VRNPLEKIPAEESLLFADFVASAKGECLRRQDTVIEFL